MSNPAWKGGGRAQVSELNATNVEVNDEFYLTGIKADNRHTLSHTATEATEKDVLLGLQAAAQQAKSNGDIPWTLLTVSLDDETSPTKATITGDNPGDEFVFETDTVDGGGTDDQTLTVTTPTTAKSPNDWTHPGNWKGGVVPVTGDNVLIPRDVVYDMEGGDRTGTPLDDFRIEPGSSINIGSEDTPLEISFSGQSTKALQCQGTGTYYIEVSDATVITFSPATSNAQSGIELYLHGVDNNQLVLELGSSGRAYVGRLGDAEIEELIINSGIILLENTTKDGGGAPPLTLSGGAVTSHIALGDVTINGGSLSQYGNVTKYTGNGGTVTQNMGNITTLHALQGATYMFGNVGFPTSVTTAKIWKGGVIRDPFQKAAFINNIALQEGARLTEVTLDLGQGITISRV